MEQALTQLEVKILLDDFTYYDDDDATETDTMITQMMMNFEYLHLT